MHIDSVKELIWAPRKSFYDYADEEWVHIVDYVLDSLREYLGVEFNNESVQENVGDGFSIDIESKTTILNALDFELKGIVGGQILDEGRFLNIEVTLFPYSKGLKLSTNTGKEYILFTFIKNESGEGVWSSCGWMKDEYGEYEYFNRPLDEIRLKFEEDTEKL